jgi:hypothetical protein
MNTIKPRIFGVKRKNDSFIQQMAPTRARENLGHMEFDQ